MSAMRISAAISPATTRSATSGDATISTSPTDAQMGIFKTKGMLTYILNSCDKELQIWIGNNIDKVRNYGLILFKIL